MHTRDPTKTGFPIEKLALIQAWDEGGDLFTDTERATPAWAETVTHVAQTGVPDEAFQVALAVFGEKGLVDVTIAISLMNAYSRMAISFRNMPQNQKLTEGRCHVEGILLTKISVADTTGAMGLPKARSPHILDHVLSDLTQPAFKSSRPAMRRGMS
jgi:hypothetical protein